VPPGAGFRASETAKPRSFRTFNGGAMTMVCDLQAQGKAVRNSRSA